MTATTAAFVALPRRCQAATAYLVGDFVRKAPANNDMPRRAKLLVHLVLDHLQSIHTRCQRTGFTVGACRKQAPGDDTWLLFPAWAVATCCAQPSCCSSAAFCGHAVWSRKYFVQRTAAGRGTGMLHTVYCTHLSALLHVVRILFYCCYADIHGFLPHFCCHVCVFYQWVLCLHVSA